MWRLGCAALVLVATATGLQAAPKFPSVMKTRAAVRNAAAEPWVDGYMRKTMRVADHTIGSVVRKLGGLKNTQKQRFDFMGLSTLASFPTGQHVEARIDDHESGSLHTVTSGVSLTAGANELGVQSSLGRSEHGTSRHLTATRMVDGKKHVVERLYLPATEHTPAQVISTQKGTTLEKASGRFKFGGIDLTEKDSGRAYQAHLGAIRAYADAASPSVKRAIRRVLKRIDVLQGASPKLSVNVREELGMAGTTLESPGLSVRTSVSQRGTISLDLDEPSTGVSRRIFLEPMTGGAIITTTRPRKYAAGMGEEEHQVHASGLGERVSVDRSRSLTRPVAPLPEPGE